MRSKNQKGEAPHWSREEARTAFLFWLFWSLYVCLSTILVLAMLTDWPEFLHSANPYLLK
jgi:hypothetical protein